MKHQFDVILSMMATQITSLKIVCSTVYSSTDNKNTKLRVTCLYEGNSPVTGEFPAQRAINADNVSIRWRHHAPADGKDFHNEKNALHTYVMKIVDVLHNCLLIIFLCSFLPFSEANCRSKTLFFYAARVISSQSLRYFAVVVMTYSRCTWNFAAHKHM